MQPAAPLLSIRFSVSQEVYEACTLMLGTRLQKKHMPRNVALGIIFIAGAVGFLAYIILYLHQPASRLNLLSLLLLLLGVYHLLYYPLLFQPLLRRRAENLYQRSDTLGKPVILRFFSDYLEEQHGESRNRIQWSMIQAIHREPAFWLLRLTGDSGIIIPLRELDEEQKVALEQILQDKQAG